MNVGLNVFKAIKTNVLPRFNKFITTAFSSKYLLYTNVGISITLSGVGDMLEQHYEIFTGQLTEWDKIRTRNMSCSGGSVGVICHFWYRFLDHRLPGYTIRIVMKKILVDQFVGSPLCISAFFISVGVLEGSSIDDFVKEVKDKAWKLYFAEWMVWPPAQFINFYLLPNRFRVFYDNTISLGYDVYTSHVKHSSPLDSKKSGTS